MVWALRDPIDRMQYSRHNNGEVVIEKYLRDVFDILNKVYLTFKSFFC
jgi:hypothetical protein